MNTVRTVWVSPIKKHLDNPTSLRLSINAHCWGCMGGDIDPDGRVLTMRAIRHCQSEVCSLNGVRPYQNGADVLGELTTSELSAYGRKSLSALLQKPVSA